jgi:cytochrome c oxidase cbb3-type subunit 1
MGLSFFRRPHSAALGFIVMASIWFVIGTVYGALSATHLVAPEFFHNIPWLVFGRIRPIHVNTVLYGFVAGMLVGCGAYYVPRLLRTRLWSEPLAWFSVLTWNLAVASGPLSFSFGITQGREYSEYIWMADVTLMVSLIALLIDVMMTILRRAEDTLYVAVWYFTGMLLWSIGCYPIGNVMWHPATGAASGMLDSLYLWFWGHNLPGLLLTPLAVGAAFYVIPLVTSAPLYSHLLSWIGFWSLVVFYSHIGAHHILQTPIADWQKVLAITSSIAMVIPVFTVLANLWLGSRGRGGVVLHHPAGRFVLVGLIWYLLTCIQGPLQSLPVLQQVTHLTNWTVGHSHIAVLGFAGYIALGTMWLVVPQIVHRKVWSRQLVFAQFWLISFGLTGFFVVLTIAGLIQGESWWNGLTVYRVLPEIHPYMVMRAALGASIVSAAVIGLFNLFKTIYSGPPFNPYIDEDYFA